VSADEGEELWLGCSETVGDTVWLEVDGRFDTLGFALVEGSVDIEGELLTLGFAETDGLLDGRSANTQTKGGMA
jgi:hypothetical protein